LWDLAGFNSNHFDIPLLAEEFFRAGIDFDLKGRRFVDIQKHLSQNGTQESQGCL